MKIEHNNGQRVYLSDDNGFFDIDNIDYIGARIDICEHFCVFAVIQEDKNFKSIVMFKNRDYLDEWINDNRDKKIVYFSDPSEDNQKEGGV